MPKDNEAQFAPSNKLSQQLVPKKTSDNGAQEVVKRPTALDFKKVEKLKELIL